MAELDLNLLIALEALLAEGSVTGAARRLRLSPSAMSRTLARLRAATGDPLLVQAGRTLVPTPHAEGLAGRVPALARDVRAALSPPATRLAVERLDRTFTIRASDGFLALLAAPLVEAVTVAAPGVRLRFAPKPDKSAEPLRTGEIDLDVGTSETSAPELRSRLILRDRFVGAARRGHPLLGDVVTPERYAECVHVVTSRRGAAHGPVDDGLRALGLERTVAAIVPGFGDALAIARSSDLIALVPRSCLRGAGSDELGSFELPVETPEIGVHVMWHPRQDADPAHRWLRETLFSVGREKPDPSG